MADASATDPVEAGGSGVESVTSGKAARGGEGGDGKAPVAAAAPGPYAGLINHGNTCYLNSTLQALYHTAPLRRWVLSDEHGVDGGRLATSAVSAELHSLFAKMSSSTHPTQGTVKLQEGFGWTQDDMGYQHDILEMMQAFLNALETVETRAAASEAAASEGGEDSDFVATVKKIFGGTWIHTMTCTVCGSSRDRKEAFLDVGVSVLGEAKSLEDGLLELVSPTVVEVDCETCGCKKPHTKSCVAAGNAADGRGGLPPVLAVSVLRYEWDMTTMQRNKVESPFSCPQVLDARYLKGELSTFDIDAPASPDAASNAYDLYSMIVHEGTATQGHYYSFIKVPSDAGSEVWARFDDTKVSTISIDEEMPDIPGGVAPTREAKVKQSASAMAKMFDDGDEEDFTAASPAEGATATDADPADGSTEHKDPPRPGRISGMRDNGATAYVLFYRRRDATWNNGGRALDVSDGRGGPSKVIEGYGVPAELVPIVQAADAIRTEEEEKAATEAARMTLKVSYISASGEERKLKSKSFEIDRRDSIPEVIRRALEQHNVPEELLHRLFSDERAATFNYCARFRLYTPDSHFKGPVLDGDAASFHASLTAAELVRDRSFVRPPTGGGADRQHVSLLLELSLDAGLEPVDDNLLALHVRAVTYVADEGVGGAGATGAVAPTLAPGREVLVPRDSSVGEFLGICMPGDVSVIANMAGTVLFAPMGDAERSDTADVSYVLDMAGTRDDSERLFGGEHGCKLFQGDTLVVASCSQVAGIEGEALVTSRVVRATVDAVQMAATEEADTIEVKFNKPGTKRFKNTVQIHKRKTFADLLVLAAAELEIGLGEVAIDVTALRLGKKKKGQEVVVTYEAVLAMRLQDAGVEKNGQSVKLITPGTQVQTKGKSASGPKLARVLPFIVEGVAQGPTGAVAGTQSTMLLPLAPFEASFEMSVAELKLLAAGTVGWQTPASSIRARVLSHGRLGRMLCNQQTVGFAASKFAVRGGKGKKGKKDKGKPAKLPTTHPDAQVDDPLQRLEIVFQRVSCAEEPQPDDVVVGILPWPPSHFQAAGAVEASAVGDDDEVVGGLAGLGFGDDEEDAGEDPGVPIKCPICTFDNHWPARTCEVCGGDLPVVTAASDGARASSVTEAAGGGGSAEDHSGGGKVEESLAGTSREGSTSAPTSGRFEMLLDARMRGADVMLVLSRQLEVPLEDLCMAKANKSGSFVWLGGGSPVCTAATLTEEDSVRLAMQDEGAAFGATATDESPSGALPGEAIVVKKPLRGNVEDLEASLNKGKLRVRDGETIAVGSLGRILEWERALEVGGATDLLGLLDTAGDPSAEVHVGIHITV